MKLSIKKEKSALHIQNLNKHITWGTTFATSCLYAYHTLQKGQSKDPVDQSRLQLIEEIGSPHLITLKQTHSNTIHLINRHNVSNYLDNPLIEGDALITDIPNITLGILTADCIPIMIAIPKITVAAVHAGWKGILNQILPKTIQKLSDYFNFNPKDMVIFIGPHARSCCYEVREDFTNRFDKPVIRTDGTKTFLDMETMILHQLHAFGINQNQILSLSHCTQCHTKPSYHSYRHNANAHRNLTWIGLK